jgi:hypothetical protein
MPGHVTAFLSRRREEEERRRGGYSGEVKIKKERFCRDFCVNKYFRNDNFYLPPQKQKS